MLIAPKYSSRLTGLLVLITAAGWLGAAGFVFAADRAVVGELWSADG
jgi:hypothetical protein